MAESSYFEIEPDPERESHAVPEAEPGCKPARYKQLDTPGKNRVLGYIQCCEDYHIKWTKAAVARALKVSRSQVEYAIKNPSPRTKKNSAPKNKNAQKITSEHLDAVEAYINTLDFSDGRVVNWNDVISHLGMDVTAGHLNVLMEPRLRRRKIKTITPRAPRKSSTQRPEGEQPSQVEPPQRQMSTEQPSQETTSQVQFTREYEAFFSNCLPNA